VDGTLGVVGSDRDDLESAEPRLETLEAELAASEARVEIAEAEARELRIEREQLRGKIELLEKAATVSPAAASKQVKVLIGLFVVASMTAFVALRFAASPPLDPVRAAPVALSARSAPPSPDCDCAPNDHICQMRCDTTRKAPAPVPSASPSTHFREEIGAALDRATARARSCPEAVAGQYRVRLRVIDGGATKDVEVTPPDDNAAVTCITEAFEAELVEGFHGESVAVSKGFRLEG